MIVGGAKCGEQHADENENVWPALAWIKKLTVARFSKEKDQTQNSRQKEQQIRNNIAEVRDAEPSALVSKMMVGERLRRPRDEQGGDSNGDRQDQERPEGPALPTNALHSF
jgi:hypothetical protein